MIQGIYQSAAAADVMQTWNDVIARNIAASTTPGYKLDAVSFGSKVTGSMGFQLSPNRAVELPVMTPTVNTVTKFDPGPLRRSDNPYEFAIDGTGFFRVQRPDGNFVYTRNGTFHLSSDGQLVNQSNYPVMGESGPIQLLIDGGPISVNAEGRVMQGDQEVGALTVYGFNDPSSLQRTAGGFVVDPNNPQFPLPQENAHVVQGAVEESNVSSIRQMVELVEVSNSLQANQKVIQSIDDLLERTVQVLGGPNV